MPIECYFEVTADQRNSREGNLIEQPSLNGTDRICSVDKKGDTNYRQYQCGHDILNTD
jgi:hypothetical protein